MGKHGPGQDHNTEHGDADADADYAPGVDAFDRAWESLAASFPSSEADAPSATLRAMTRADVQRDLDAAAISARQWNAESVDVSDETADLLLLALRLQDELPRDLPDPAFRSALLAQLLEQAAAEHAAQSADHVTLVPVAAAAMATPTPTLPSSDAGRVLAPAPVVAATATAASSRSGNGAIRTAGGGSAPRFSYMRAIAALAAVMVAAISVGTLAIWMNDDDGDTPGGVAGAPQTTVTSQAVSTADSAATNGGNVASGEPTSSAGSGAAETTPANGSVPVATTPLNPTATIASVRTPIATLTTTSEAASTSTVSTNPTAAATASASASATASNGQPTVILLANVPPVDSAHIEQGPVPASDGGGPTPPREDTSVMLETTMPEPDGSAPLYRLSPPSVEPSVLVQEVADTLGIVGEAFETQGVDGGTEWAVTDDTNAWFQWDPVSGAFSFSAPTDDTAPTGGMDPTEALAVATQWLGSFGYPVDEMTLTAEPSAIDPTLWTVSLGVDAVPHPGLGHPIGVTAHIDLDGNVVSASGYWLTLTLQEDAPLIAMEDAWVVITDCKGIWTGGGIVGAGGDFRVDAIELSYLLTTLGDSKLVLQPVYRASGEFTASDGSTARVSVYVQAVRDK